MITENQFLHHYQIPATWTKSASKVDVRWDNYTDIKITKKCFYNEFRCKISKTRTISNIIKPDHTTYRKTDEITHMSNEDHLHNHGKYLLDREVLKQECHWESIPLLTTIKALNNNLPRAWHVCISWDDMKRLVQQVNMHPILDGRSQIKVHTDERCEPVSVRRCGP